MLSRHGLDVSHNAVASFLRTHGARRRNFLDGISEGRRLELLKQLRALWTHDSTAIEGNTLTLGDTMAVLEYGIAVKGKPLRDHQDVVAHARGVDFIQALLGRGRIKEEDVLSLHRIVIAEQSNDICRPVGAWKREDNGTYGAEVGKSVYMPYASADETPLLMAKWLESFNAMFNLRSDEDSALNSYVAAHVSFVRIHPFFDGNGRIARLLANLPVLHAGFPPIVIPAEARQEYINELWAYQRAVGVIAASRPELLPDEERLDGFKTLVRGWWSETIDLVDEAKRGRNRAGRVVRL
ncbi:MAG: Fic family protein [Kiritimatiellae bacterium]|nr:Fic family protein [Kiritimatiellia bacterium]